MKREFIVTVLLLFCLNSAVIYAQSSRSSQSAEPKKANRRPVETTAPKPEKNENTKIEETIPEDSIVDDADVIEVATEIVTFPVKILDRKGRFISGLMKENFKVYEDKSEQEIAFFNNEQQPFTVALVLDMSYSATFKIDEIQAAAISFIDQLRKDDKVMVVSFSEDIIVGTEATSDRQRIYNAIKQTKINYGTRLYDAIDLVVNQKLKKISGRKAIVLFTDGVDTSSERAQDYSNLHDVEETDALVYPIRYDTYADVQRMKNQTVIVPPTQPSPIPSKNKSPFPFPIPAGGIGTADSKGTRLEDYQKAEQYLNDMANRTGGRIYEASSLVNLDRAFSSIASELREFYSLGYYLPEGAEPGQKRRVKIKVDRENVSVKARETYTVGKKVKKGKR